MDWYYYIAIAAIVLQVLFLIQVYRNYHFALSKYKKERTGYRPKVGLIVPCKGIDASFEKNISSFFEQAYEDYLLFFVVADRNDPAYSVLSRLKDKLSPDSKAKEIRILIAGKTAQCSQKIHNLLCAYRQMPGDVSVLAFADSDACVRTDWLSHIVYPLRKKKNGAASGYRWFVPERNNPATLALSAVNAKIAQLLGPYRYNHAWGGSTAIRLATFKEIGLEEIWQNAISDDLSLSYAVKKAGLRVVFVPACLVASYESTSWAKLFEFARRQFLITRITTPGLWWFGLFSSIYSVLGLWASAVIAIYAGVVAEPRWRVFAAVPIVFFVGHIYRSVLRQIMISRLLRKDFRRMKSAMAADVLASWLFSPLLLIFIISSAIGRTIQWRGIRYKLIGPTETMVVKD